jgi:hypothetical protein
VDGRGLPIYSRPPCLRHSGSQGQATSTNGRAPGVLFSSVPCTEDRSLSKPCLDRGTPIVAGPWALRHPESCLTIFGGVPGGARYRAVVGF